MIKGWGMHQFHDDRYFILFGELLLVLYDDRPNSPTNGFVAKVAMSEYRRQLINIPAGVWHGLQNLGSSDALLLNFPTHAYDYADPDHYRLPWDSPEIPYAWVPKGAATFRSDRAAR